jgi:epsilon-lactone hydrolase
MTSFAAWLIKKALPFYFARWSDKTIAEQRLWQARRARSARLPADVVFQPVTADGIPAEWAAPPNPGRNLILYLHGGGYCLGSIAVSRDFAAQLAQATGCRTLTADYRLAPEHPFPAAALDAAAVYRWLLAQGAAPANIILAGDSAGGGLAVATLLALRDAGTPLPAGAICISPWVDLALTGESMVSRAAVDPILDAAVLGRYAAAYAGDAPLTEPALSPLYADLRGLPPLLIQVGGAEVLLDDAVRLAERARRAGVTTTLQEWPGLFHVFQAVSFLPESKRAFAQMAEFCTAVAIP